MSTPPLRKLFPLAVGCFLAAAPFSFSLAPGRPEAPRPRRCDRIARSAGGDAGDDSSVPPSPLDVPWWQLEDQAERLMAPRMPFRVEQVSPPPVKKLGYALLDARTARGDVINMKGTEKDDYVVSKVRFLYDLVGGKYRIRTKVLEVQTPRRYKINEKLAGLVNRDEA
mmetsp:Transcript_37536/g.88215  ORF Transcript_37536/g.88215 Transcript_37536/m.88215 type:complete len:168 (-) Transcript_37536:57-560(-)